MALPLLATPAELADEVDDASVADSPRAVRLLSRASALVRAYTGRTFTDDNGDLVEPVPDAVHEVVLAAAARAWRNPQGYVQDTTGPFTVRWSERTADGVYLTGDERMMLGSWRTSGLWTLRAERRDTYLDQVREDLDPHRLGVY
ncbi:hypothetical protein [Spirillospora sp. NBC_01491]|uniref:hypothetical protein n=1 Tax=Spirillospora sp. NBC_01491 TaxID=2976007 RepID=UPI002E37D02A|nr:hypothetical protein [Spirillospora sp. NBC_01491]